MRYIFYADVYFIQNLMIKVAALYLAFCACKVELKMRNGKGIAKLCMVSAITTLVEIVLLISSTSYPLFVITVSILEVPIMVLILVGKNRKQIVRLVAYAYFVLVLINGVLEGLWNLFGEGGSYLIYILFSCCVVVVGFSLWRNYERMQKGIFQMRLSHKGRRIETSGLYDTGNHLRDPYTGKGVHIISINLLEKLNVLCKDVQKKEASSVFIPYQSLGNETGVLEVYYIEEVMILGEKGSITIHNCPMGVTKDNLFEGKKYQIILNEEVF